MFPCLLQCQSGFDCSRTTFEIASDNLISFGHCVTYRLSAEMRGRMLGITLKILCERFLQNFFAIVGNLPDNFAVKVWFAVKGIPDGLIEIRCNSIDFPSVCRSKLSFCGQLVQVYHCFPLYLFFFGFS